ncbi:MAG: extracellular solute-binding protein [Alphaproteobacteria bacterium]|nr:extracellular solute-binding protein [Alphaproteobacteria bacterium]
MKRRTMLGAVAVGAMFAFAPGAHAQQVNLNVMTAGDQNMVDYITEYLGPMFEKANPGVKVRAVGTGPGDAGSQRIWERLEAQRKAGSASVDVDVAVVHQKMAGMMVKEGLLAKYRGEVSTGKMATNDVTKNALGINVDGYVIPMFNSQIAIAYNPDKVKTPPSSYDDLVAFAHANPKRFGHNGIRGGMSGVGFVFGWLYAYAPQPAKLIDGPYDDATVAALTPALQKMKAFNNDVTITPGNAGTLDALNRGEIDMGPVWMDMFYSWQADGKLSPNLKLTLLKTGLPGQPMYYVVPEKAANAAVARKFVELATSPQVQAKGIVERFNWLPGIDASYVQQYLDKKIWDKLFKDVPPDMLKAMGKPMPQSDYFTKIQEQYEKIVLN